MLESCPSSLVTLVSWVETMGRILATNNLGWSSLHPRTREGCLGLALTTLKMSDFKLGSNNSVLAGWLQPSLSLLRILLSQLTEESQLCLTLLTGLVTRLSAKLWLPALHSDCSLQLLLKKRSQPQRPLSTLRVSGSTHKLSCFMVNCFSVAEY